MSDAFQELSEVGEELQHQDIDLFQANKKLEFLLNTFIARKVNPGTFYKQAVTSVNNKIFMQIQLYETPNARSIDLLVFYGNLIISIENRMLSGEDGDLADSVRLVAKSTWPKDIKGNRLLLV